MAQLRAERRRNGRGHADRAGEDARPDRRRGRHGPLSGAGRRVPAPAAAGRRRSTTCRPAKNFIDELVFKKLKTLGVPPSAVCDDATFLRRVSVDIAGRLPTVEETRAVPGRPGSGEARQADRPAARQPGLRRLFRQQVERRAAQQAAHARTTRAAPTRSTTGFATACTRTSPTTSSSARSWPPRARSATTRRWPGIAR